MIDSFLDKVAATIEKFTMADKSERLLVCLSGGADSVSLLLCLKKLGYSVSACHVNHQLRGDESERDQQFCEQLCDKLGVSLNTYRIDVMSYCRQNSVSVEEGARELRYEIFSKIPCDKICTAHTLSDCFETTIFNLARGTGLKGLCSIPPMRENIIRPLIECTRKEVLEFLSGLGQDYVTDSTNLTDEYNRNRIRHNVVPQLESINPSLMKSYMYTLNLLRNEEKYLKKTAIEQYKRCCSNGTLNVSMLKALDMCIKDRVLILWLKNKDISVTHDKLDNVKKIIDQSGKLNIQKGMFVVCKDGFATVESYDDGDEELSAVYIESDGEYIYGSRKITLKTLDINDIDVEISNVHKLFTNQCFDCDKIKGRLVLHKRGEGDTIRLVNRGFTSSVRKLVNKAFTSQQRNNAVILYDSDGTVFVEGYGVDERVKITPDTKHILTFEIKNII